MGKPHVKAHAPILRLRTPLRLHLIRHGETEWSLTGQYTGRTDIPLTAHGEAEARAVGKRLRGTIPFSHVLTSPLQRAQRTCELAALGPDPRIDPDLTEWSNGEDEGRTPTDVRASRPAWNLFRDGSPGGETPAQVSARADRLIDRLRALNGEVALFTHSHFGRVLAMRWIGLPAEHAERFLFGTASHSVLSYEHACADQPVIALWNAGERDRNPPQTPQRVL
jgi:probable phosphoglycerate mutase